MSSGDLNNWGPQLEGLMENERPVDRRVRLQVPAGGKRRRSLEQVVQVFCCPQPVHITIHV